MFSFTKLSAATVARTQDISRHRTWTSLGLPAVIPLANVDLANSSCQGHAPRQAAMFFWEAKSQNSEDIRSGSSRELIFRVGVPQGRHLIPSRAEAWTGLPSIPEETRFSALERLGCRELEAQAQSPEGCMRNTCVFFILFATAAGFFVHTCPRYRSACLASMTEAKGPKAGPPTWCLFSGE